MSRKLKAQVLELKENIEQVQNFSHLGESLTEDACETEIVSRIAEDLKKSFPRETNVYIIN